MLADRTAVLEVTLDQLRQRWGTQIITRACERAPAPTISSGFPDLDRLLDGGFPVGQISLLAGAGTCGAGTLACQIAAHAQADRRPAIWLDGQSTFDAAHAEQYAVSLNELVLIQPVDLAHALALARDLADLLPGGLTVLTLPPLASGDLQYTAQELRRMANPLARANGTLLICGERQRGLSEAAGLALQLARGRWLARSGVVCGYETTVTVHKGRGNSPGRSVTFEIVYPEAL